jgi:hypothetical protein
MYIAEYRMFASGVGHYTTLYTGLPAYMERRYLDVINIYWLSSVDFILYILYMIAHCIQLYCILLWNIYYNITLGNVIVPNSIQDPCLYFLMMATCVSRNMLL